MTYQKYILIIDGATVWLQIFMVEKIRLQTFILKTKFLE